MYYLCCEQTNKNDMKTINLEEIYYKHQQLWHANEEPYNVNSDTEDYRINAMREACNQAIELAASTKHNIYDKNGTAYISRDSILKIKSQII